MATTLDFSKFSFGPEEIRAVSELVFDAVLKAPEIDFLHTVYPNIVTEKEVGFIGKGGLVGVKNNGCDPQPQDWNISSRLVTWTPEDWEILIHACWKDLRSTAALYSLKTGTGVADFENSDYMAIVVECLSNSMKDFVIRYMWFNDKDSQNVSANGIITDGLDVKYFNIIDGFWKQILIQLTIPNNNQRVTITENKGTTYAAQKLDPKNMQGYLQSLVYEAPLLLRRDPSGLIMCTQTFYDAYSISLQGMNLETMYKNLTEGIGGLTYNGVPLIPIPTWDEMIQSYEDSGTKWNNPHRALYTTPSILGVGVDNPSSFGEIDIWYNKDARTVKMEAMGIADAKLLNPDRLKVAI